MAVRIEKKTPPAYRCLLQNYRGINVLLRRITPHFERKLNRWGWLNSPGAGAKIIRDDEHSQFLAAMSANRFSQHASVFRRGFRRHDTFQFFAISRRFNALHASKI